MEKAWEIAQEIMLRIADHTSTEGLLKVRIELLKEVEDSMKGAQNYREVNAKYFSKIERYTEERTEIEDKAQEIWLDDQIQLLMDFRKQNKHQIDRLESKAFMKREIAIKLGNVILNRA